MPKKKGGHKKKKIQQNTRRAMIYATGEGQVYARITHVFGNGRYRCICLDTNTERMAILRGSLRRAAKNVVVDAIIIVSLRDFQDDKCDIVHIYKQEEKHELVNRKIVPDNTQERDIESAFIFEKEEVEKPKPKQSEIDDMFSSI